MYLGSYPSEFVAKIAAWSLLASVVFYFIDIAIFGYLCGPDEACPDDDDFSKLTWPWEDGICL